METLVSFLPGLALAMVLLTVVFWGLSYRALTIEDNASSVDMATTIGVLSMVAGFSSARGTAVLLAAPWFSSR